MHAPTPESEVYLEGGTTPVDDGPPLSILSVVFWGVGIIEIMAGLVLCAELWPGAPKEGYVWKTAAYLPALTWLAAGVISGCVSWALALGLMYLKGIYLNTVPRTMPQARVTREERP